MRISTREFLLGSLPELLAQQGTINTLNREIATGQTMLDATANPAGAGQAVATATQIHHLTSDAQSAQVGMQSIQATLSVLEQVGTVIDRLRQVALSSANAATGPSARQALALQTQQALQQLVQLANTQGAGGDYIFAGSRTRSAPFVTGSTGAVSFVGDAATNTLQIAPGLTVPVTLSGQGVFVDLPAGRGGVAITADAANSGSATAAIAGVTSLSQVAAARLAGTQYQISFSATSGGGLAYAVASGTGSPGASGFAATSGTVASGSFAGGTTDLQFAGIDVRVTGTPAAGDQFVVQTGAQSSLFQTVRDLAAALASSAPNQPLSATALQKLQNVIGNLDGAQTALLSNEAALGAGQAEIQTVQANTQTATTNAQVALSNLQSADLPQVMTNYTASITALQAAMTVFSRLQNLSLFSVIRG